MKKLLIITSVLWLIANHADAQKYSYKKVKVGVGAGMTNAYGEGSKDGILFYLEPTYEVVQQIRVGLRIEYAAMTRGTVDATGYDFDGSSITSVSLVGKYYFRNEMFRPFVAAGVGAFRLGTITYQDPTFGEVILANAETKVGFFPSIGFDFGHLNMSVDYSFLPLVKIENPKIMEFTNSYMTIKLGCSFGGGKDGKLGVHRRRK